MSKAYNDAMANILNGIEATRTADVQCVCDLLYIIRRSDSATLRKLLAIASALDRINARKVKT